MQENKGEQNMPFRRLVFWPVQSPFGPIEQFQFGDHEVCACLEENAHTNEIRIEIYDADQRCLAELFATLSRMFSSDAHKNIDFCAGLLRGRKTGVTDLLWKENGVLRTDGTFSFDDLVPHK